LWRKSHIYFIAVPTSLGRELINGGVFDGVRGQK
jgi:hypothetical protein